MLNFNNYLRTVVTRTEINQTDKEGMYKVMYWDECNGFPAEKVFTSRAKATREVNKLNKAIEDEKTTLATK